MLQFVAAVPTAVLPLDSPNCSGAVQQRSCRAPVKFYLARRPRPTRPQTQPDPNNPNPTLVIQGARGRFPHRQLAGLDALHEFRCRAVLQRVVFGLPYLGFITCRKACLVMFLVVFEMKLLVRVA